MSSSRKRTEHIERIRYPNPLPLPPYPPKLLHIPTPASRFADPRNVGLRLAQAHPLPVVVDAEAGMPLNLTDFPQAWYTDAELEADDDVYPRLDPEEVEVDTEDAFLLSDLLEKLPNGGTNGVARPDGSLGAIADATNVTWLRRTEYLATEQQKRKKSEMAWRTANEVIDASKEAQLARIKDTFVTCNQPLADMRHPTKPGLRAVDSFALLPDPDTWATEFDVFRFGDLPGRLQGNAPLPDPRLETAILRPHVDVVGQPIYSLFLINAPSDEANEDDEAGAEDENMFGDDIDDEEAQRPKKKSKKKDVIIKTREEIAALEDEQTARLLQGRRQGFKVDAEVQDTIEAQFDIEESEEAPAHLAYAREYEAHDESERKDQELIVTYIDGSGEASNNPEGDSEASAGGNGVLPPVSHFEQLYRCRNPGDSKSAANGQASGSSAKDAKVAYYHPVSLRAALRVRRRRAHDPRPPEHWDAISLGKRSLSMYEKVERLHARVAVDDMDVARLPERIEVPVEETVAEAEEVEVVGKSAGVADGAADSAKGDVSDDTAEDNEKSREGASEEEKAEVKAGNKEDDDDEEDNDNEDESGSDDGSAQSDEEMDDDELAALRAEAGADAVVDADVDAEEGDTGGRRRSRRAAATADGGVGVGELQPREPLLMDVDEED